MPVLTASAWRAVHEIYWPVFVHSFNFSYPEYVPLNAIEEALLRIVAAGVSTAEEAYELLGIGRPYFEQIAASLSQVPTRPWPHPLRRDSEGRMSPGEGIAEAVEMARKITLCDREAEFVRDGMFDRPIDYCDGRFKILKSAAGDSGGSWLGPMAEAKLDNPHIDRIRYCAYVEGMQP